MACVSARSSSAVLFVSGLLYCAAFALAGCLVSAPQPRDYAATIERIDEHPGTYYSPKTGAKLLVCLQLRLAASAKFKGGESLRVFLTDLYSAEIHGRPGDSISFSYDRALPVSGEVDFATLANYHVVRKVR